MSREDPSIRLENAEGDVGLGHALGAVRWNGGRAPGRGPGTGDDGHVIIHVEGSPPRPRDGPPTQRSVH
jgi:hypothetical protein